MNHNSSGEREIKTKKSAEYKAMYIIQTVG